MFWETDTKLNENNNAAEQKLCEYWLKICEEKIPPGPYLFVIDAGTLGCLEMHCICMKRDENLLFHVQLTDHPFCGMYYIHNKSVFKIGKFVILQKCWLYLILQENHQRKKWLIFYLI